MIKVLLFLVSVTAFSAQAATNVYGSLFMALGAGHDSKTYFSNIAKVSNQISNSGFRGDVTAALSGFYFSSATVNGDLVTYHFHKMELEGDVSCHVNLSFTNSDVKAVGVSNVSATYYCREDLND